MKSEIEKRIDYINRMHYWAMTGVWIEAAKGEQSTVDVTVNQERNHGNAE